MAAINAQQIRKIYAIGNALGIVERGNEDDDLHALVSALTGKDSVKSLTYAEAQAVITDLQKRQGAAPLPRHKPKTHPERPGGATDGQQRKVWALMYQLAKADKEKVAGLPEQEASDWAFLAAEVINWEWLAQVLEAAGWEGTTQEAIDIIRAAVIVEEGMKVGVEAEQPEV